MNAIKLLHEFKVRRTESAVSELVRLYTNLVYSAALRRLGSQGLAQEAAQVVFLRLAKNLPALGSDAELSAWLHRTTVHVSIDIWRSEVRRRVREEQTAAMQLHSNDDLSWKEIAPALDEALNELADSDRQAILLRYFDEKSMRELGSVFGISEDAAKMRINRALERLRHQLGARGVTCTSVALGAFLAERAVQSAPSDAAAAIAAWVYPVVGSATTGVGSAASAVRGAGLTLGKVLSGVGALTLVGLTAWLGTHRPEAGIRLSTAGSEARSLAASAVERSAPFARTQHAVEMTTNRIDPVKLLQGVARARERIGSGSVEFQVETVQVERSQTNQLQLTALFEGSRQRFEQFGREYAYSYDPDPERAQEIVRKADAFGADREGAVRAGLLGGFEAHSVTIHDGANLMRYRENDGKPEGTSVDDSGKGSSSFVFDPCCLGLAPWLGPTSTIEGCLLLGSTNPVELVGEDSVEGVACWHLRVPAAQRLELWLNAARPVQVMKVQSGQAMVLSKYDSGAQGDPLPKEVVSTDNRDGVAAFATRFVRTASQYNITPDPETFALAGLGMKVGTDVVDIRIHRRIGSWTGAGLSGELVSKSRPVPQEWPNLEEQLMILDNDPTSGPALDAATWILLNTPDGPAVEKAATVIVREHVRSPELGRLCEQLERVRPRSAEAILQAVLKDNPNPEIRATACFTLATLRKDACQFGADKKLTLEADQLFERVINEFGSAGAVGVELARKARPELTELRRLSIGRPAPDFEGTDLRGERIRLSEQRGKVVVVVFWTKSTVDSPEEHRQVLAPLAGQPFTWIGVNCDDRLVTAQAAAEQHQIAWPIVWDGRSGPIASDWNVHSWTSVFVLDKNGVIRSRGARGRALAEVVGTLLAE